MDEVNNGVAEIFSTHAEHKRDALMQRKSLLERELDAVNAELRQIAREEPAEIKTAEYCDRPRREWKGGV